MHVNTHRNKQLKHWCHLSWKFCFPLSHNSLSFVEPKLKRSTGLSTLDQYSDNNKPASHVVRLNTFLLHRNKSFAACENSSKSFLKMVLLETLTKRTTETNPHNSLFKVGFWFLALVLGSDIVLSRGGTWHLQLFYLIFWYSAPPVNKNILLIVFWERERESQSQGVKSSVISDWDGWQLHVINKSDELAACPRRTPPAQLRWGRLQPPLENELMIALHTIVQKGDAGAQCEAASRKLLFPVYT